MLCGKLSFWPWKCYTTHMKSTGSWLLDSRSRAENLNLSNVWFGSMSQSFGMKSALCLHQTFTAMLRSYDRT